MTPEEARKCKVVAKMYRALKQENEQLRQELAEKNRIDLRMATEDQQVFALVNHQKPDIKVVPAHTQSKPVFDFDTAMIEPIPVEPKTKWKMTFGVLLLSAAGLLIWIAYRYGWLDLLIFMTIAVTMILVAYHYGWL